jgi:hypothetical protein
LPVTRPDLHFLYAVFEETLIILAFALEIRRAWRALGTMPAVASAG